MKTKIAFDFILDHLHPLPVRVKPMFGCHAIYVNEKLVFVTRKKQAFPESNGIWIATHKDYHKSLKRDFPSLQSVYILSRAKNETNWQMIHESADDFEELAIKLCVLISAGDKRIGKIPQSKKKKA